MGLPDQAQNGRNGEFEEEYAKNNKSGIGETKEIRKIDIIMSTRIKNSTN